MSAYGAYFQTTQRTKKRHKQLQTTIYKTRCSEESDTVLDVNRWKTPCLALVMKVRGDVYAGTDIRATVVEGVARLDFGSLVDPAPFHYFCLVQGIPCKDSS